MTDPLLATEADVHHAYRLILRRDPDEAGLAFYHQLVTDGLTLEALCDHFFRSDEYHALLESRGLAELATVDLGGYQVVVQRRDSDFGRDIFHHQEYDESIRNLMRDNLRAGDLCLDLGANIGVMTFLAASIVGPEGRVFAVEPNPENVQQLYRGLVVNGFTNVSVYPLAVSDRRAVFSLTGRSNTELVGARPSDAGGHFVQSAAFDEVLGELPRLDFVKIDIEGHEPPALRGLTRLVTRHRPTLLAEFNPRCLKTQQEDPMDYLGFVFGLYPRVRAVSAFGDDVWFERADDVMALWRKRDADLTAAGELPAGLLHFDLLVPRP